MAKRKRNRATRKSEKVTRIELREIGKLIFVAFIVIAGIYVVQSVENMPIKTVVINSALQKVDKQDVRDSLFREYVYEFEAFKHCWCIDYCSGHVVVESKCI